MTMAFIWIGNDGYGRKPYHLSLPHQTKTGLEIGKKRGFHTIEIIEVSVDDIDQVYFSRDWYGEDARKSYSIPKELVSDDGTVTTSRIA